MASILDFQLTNKTQVKLKQQWSTIPTTKNHLSPQIIEHRIDHDMWCWLSRSCLGTAQKSGGVKPFNGIPTLPLLIIGSPKTIQIQTNDKKNCTDLHPLKKTNVFIWYAFLWIKKQKVYIYLTNKKRLTSSWSYGSWIYNYLWNRLSPL